MRRLSQWHHSAERTLLLRGAPRVRTGHFLPSLESPSPTEPSRLEGLLIISGTKMMLTKCMYQHVLHAWNLALAACNLRPSPILKMLRATSGLAQLQLRPQWLSAPRSCLHSSSLPCVPLSLRPMLVFLALPPLSGSRRSQGVPEALEGPIQALASFLMLDSLMAPRCIFRSILPFVFRGSCSICTMLCGLR